MPFPCESFIHSKTKKINWFNSFKRTIKYQNIQSGIFPHDPKIIHLLRGNYKSPVIAHCTTWSKVFCIWLKRIYIFLRQIAPSSANKDFPKYAIIHNNKKNRANHWLCRALCSFVFDFCLASYFCPLLFALLAHFYYVGFQDHFFQT